ncbi:putative transporter [Ilyonectria robusta]
MSTQQLSYRQLESDVGSMGAEGEESDKHISLAGTINEPNSDPNIVDWDGPKDPENPLNWSSSKKNMHVIIVSLFSLAADKLLGQKKDGPVAQPEKRLILMKWFGPITPLGCFLYGWSAYYHTHWIVPILGTFIVGLGSLFVVIPGQIYLVDAFGPEAAASALAANLLIRSPFGAFLTLAASPLYEKLGLGWGNSVLGFICLAFTPVPWLFYRYGETLRTRFPVEL